MKQHTDKNGLALRKIRKIRGLTIKEAASLLSCSQATLKRRESGKHMLTKNEIETFLNAYGIDFQDFLLLKLGKDVSDQNLKPMKKIKIIEHKNLRRSYQKVISKEVLALKHLRQKKGLMIKQACSLCNYDKSTIGAVENGRINLTKDRVEHIVKSYGFKLQDYFDLLDSSFDRIELEKKCFSAIQKMSNKNVETVFQLISNIQLK